MFRISLYWVTADIDFSDASFQQHQIDCIAHTAKSLGDGSNALTLSMYVILDRRISVSLENTNGKSSESL